MKILRIAGILLALTAPLLAAEEQEGHGREMLYRWINFAMLAGGLGYLIKKNAGPFFAGRSEAISREIAESNKLLEQSNERARAIDAQLSRLGREIEELRAKARSEMAAERARLDRQSEQALKKVFAFAEQEIGAMAKAARLELKAYAASLAVGLAEKKIAGRITPETQQALLGAFVRDL